ncbi:MAG: hypothetical protein ACERK9_08495, partial [Deltaproteobacteria bacterium]
TRPPRLKAKPTRPPRLARMAGVVPGRKSRDNIVMMTSVLIHLTWATCTADKLPHIEEKRRAITRSL